MSKKIRVATLNLWGRWGAWEHRRSALIGGFKALEPDLVALQESIRTDQYDQVADLLGDGFHIVHQQARADDGMGVSIASRWPIEETRELDLHVTPRTAGFPCATLIAEVHTPDPIGPLLFVNHLPSWQPPFEHERELQAVLAAQFIEGLVGSAAGMWSWPVTSTPIPPPRVSASGLAAKPSAVPASAIGTPGSGPIPALANQGRPSRRGIRW